jgi:hypothetical protein
MLGLRSGWGTTAEVPLHEIRKLKALATGTCSQRLQQLSRFAAWRSLPKKARSQYKLPQPSDFFAGDSSSSVTLPQGAMKCVLHISHSRIFTSKGYIPYGVSQNAIAQERGISDRTVRRHHALLSTPKKQIVQAKAAYKHIQQALRWDAPSFAPEPDISVQRCSDGQITLTEPSGKVGKPHTVVLKPDRLFEYGDRYWIYRCNLYQPKFTLCTMAYRRGEYLRSLKAAAGGEGETREQQLRKFFPLL